MGYKSPYNKVGKVMPEMKNQSKSSLMMNDASPLYETDPNKEKLIGEKTTTSRETTPEGIKGTRVTTTSQYETPGGTVKRTAEGDAAYAALSQEQRDAQDARFRAQQRSESQTRFTPDAIKLPKTKGIQPPKTKITGSLPEKVDTVVGGGDYKFDISGEKPSYSISQETVQAFGGGVKGRAGQNESDVQAAIIKSKYDKSTKTGAKNILKVTQVQGDVAPGLPERYKAQALLNRERAEETKRLNKAFFSIVNDTTSRVTDEDKSNYKTAKKNLLDRYKKLSVDINRTYRPISQGGGRENRYTKRIKAISKPVYNSETGLNTFKKNK